MAKDPLFDVEWNLDNNQSSYSAELSPDSETRNYEEIPGGYKLTVTGTQSGESYTWGYTALYDGKDHPIHGRSDSDAIEAYRLSDRVTIGFFKKDGEIGPLYRRNVSADGTTLEVLMAGRNADNSAYYDVIIYQKP
jgi:hypothetical protein